jgi:hypothetical protein
MCYGEQYRVQGTQFRRAQAEDLVQCVWVLVPGTLKPYSNGPVPTTGKHQDMKGG